MNARITLSVSLLVLALVLLILPKNTLTNGQRSPKQHIRHNSDALIGIDLAARYVANADSNFQFIDIRTPEEFADFSIPGSINIPYEKLLEKEWQGYLNPENKTNILFSNSMQFSSMAYSILLGSGASNNKILKGGINEWFAVVMTSEFKGGKLSARENALFQNRRVARNLFTEYNSLPDSLRNKLLEAKYIEETQLDGGCE